MPERMMTPDQAARAYRTGWAWSAHHLARGTTNRYGAGGRAVTTRHALHTTAMAAQAECHVATVTGRRWANENSDGPDSGVDVEPDIGVRWTPNRRHGLIVHPEDPDALRMVLVVGEPWIEFAIRGWLYAHECKVPRFWRTDVPSPAYFVNPRDIEFHDVRDLVLQSQGTLF